MGFDVAVALILLGVTASFAYLAAKSEGIPFRVFFLLATFMMFISDLWFSSRFTKAANISGSAFNQTILTNIEDNLITHYGIFLRIFFVILFLFIVFLGFYVYDNFFSVRSTEKREEEDFRRW